MDNYYFYNKEDENYYMVEFSKESIKLYLVKEGELIHFLDLSPLDVAEKIINQEIELLSEAEEAKLRLAVGR